MNLPRLKPSSIILIIAFLFSFVLIGCHHQTFRQSNEITKGAKGYLPSWNEGSVKGQIISFVEESTDSTSDSFVPVPQRIVVFDNDGTLWSEQPYYFQLQFAIDRIRQLASLHPEWNQTQPFKAVLENDKETILKSGVEGLVNLVMASHAGMSTGEFKQVVRNWIDTARHVQTGRLYKEMVYQPMLELLEYFRSNGFKTYIVSGGGVDFIRAWSEEVYGIPSEQVIGSSIKLKYEIINDEPVILRLPEIDFIDDGDGKPVGIEKFIGRIPVAAFGNSDGDLAMLQWTAAGGANRLMVYIHHTDGQREWAYDRDTHIGKLDKGLDVANQKGWVVVDMQKDWNCIYPSEMK